MHNTTELTQKEIDQLNYIYDNMQYDLVADGKIKYHGNLAYVSSHFGDSLKYHYMVISPNQPKDLQIFINDYLSYKEKERILGRELLLEDFYVKRRAIYF